MLSFSYLTNYVTPPLFLLNSGFFEKISLCIRWKIAISDDIRVRIYFGCSVTTIYVKLTNCTLLNYRHSIEGITQKEPKKLYFFEPTSGIVHNFLYTCLKRLCTRWKLMVKTAIYPCLSQAYPKKPSVKVIQLVNFERPPFGTRLR